MSLNIFKGSLNEIEYIEDAINNVKGEEDLCCFDEEAIKNFYIMMIIGFTLQQWIIKQLLM